MSDYTKILGALFAGAAAGTVLGILFAPKNGKKTLENISTCADNLKSDFEYEMQKAKEVFAAFKANISNTPEPSSSNLKDDFNNVF